MILTHSYKSYESVMNVFDGIDGKAGAAIGYVSIAASILGASTVFGVPNKQALEQQPIVVTMICGGLVCFLGAVVLAVIALYPRTMSTYPSAKVALEYWKDAGDLSTVESMIEGTEKAFDKVCGAAKKKAGILEAAYIAVAVGLAMVAVAIAARLLM